MRLPVKAVRIHDAMCTIETDDGGPGSGNWGHKGRPGYKSGSQKGGGKHYRGGTGVTGNSFESSKNDWTKGLYEKDKPSAKAMYAKHEGEAKKIGKSTEDYIMQNCGTEDKQEYVDLLAKARHWSNAHSQSVFKASLSPEEQAAMKYMEDKYGIGAKGDKVPDNAIGDYYLNLKSKAMGGASKAYDDMPDDLAYDMGIKEKPEPKPVHQPPKTSKNWMAVADNADMKDAKVLLKKLGASITAISTNKSKLDAAEQTAFDNVMNGPDDQMAAQMDLYNYLAIKQSSKGIGETYADFMNSDKLDAEDKKKYQVLFDKYGSKDADKAQSEKFIAGAELVYLASPSEIKDYLNILSKATGGPYVKNPEPVAETEKVTPEAEKKNAKSIQSEIEDLDEGINLHYIDGSMKHAVKEKLDKLDPGCTITLTEGDNSVSVTKSEDGKYNLTAPDGTVIDVGADIVAAKITYYKKEPEKGYTYSIESEGSEGIAGSGAHDYQSKVKSLFKDGMANEFEGGATNVKASFAMMPVGSTVTIDGETYKKVYNDGDKSVHWESEDGDILTAYGMYAQAHNAGLEDIDFEPAEKSEEESKIQDLLLDKLGESNISDNTVDELESLIDSLNLPNGTILGSGNSGSYVKTEEGWKDTQFGEMYDNGEIAALLTDAAGIGNLPEMFKPESANNTAESANTSSTPEPIPDPGEKVEFEDDDPPTPAPTVDPTGEIVFNYASEEPKKNWLSSAYKSDKTKFGNAGYYLKAAGAKISGIGTSKAKLAEAESNAVKTAMDSHFYSEAAANSKYLAMKLSDSGYKTFADLVDSPYINKAEDSALIASMAANGFDPAAEISPENVNVFLNKQLDAHSNGTLDTNGIQTNMKQFMNMLSKASGGSYVDCSKIDTKLDSYTLGLLKNTPYNIDTYSPKSQVEAAEQYLLHSYEQESADSVFSQYYFTNTPKVDWENLNSYIHGNTGYAVKGFTDTEMKAFKGMLDYAKESGAIGSTYNWMGAGTLCKKYLKSDQVAKEDKNMMMKMLAKASGVPNVTVSPSKAMKYADPSYVPPKPPPAFYAKQPKSDTVTASPHDPIGVVSGSSKNWWTQKGLPEGSSMKDSALNILSNNGYSLDQNASADECNLAEAKFFEAHAASANSNSSAIHHYLYAKGEALNFDDQLSHLLLGNHKFANLTMDENLALKHLWEAHGSGISSTGAHESAMAAKEPAYIMLDYYKLKAKALGNGDITIDQSSVQKYKSNAWAGANSSTHYAGTGANVPGFSQGSTEAKQHKDFGIDDKWKIHVSQDSANKSLKTPEYFDWAKVVKGTPKYKKAISAYTHAGDTDVYSSVPNYHNMNYAAAGKFPKDNPKIMEQVKNFHDALMQAPAMPEDTIIFSGQPSSHLPAFAQSDPKKLIGKDVNYGGFVSGCPTHAKAWGGKQCMWVIKVPKGEHAGAFLDSISDCSTEQEFCFAAHSKYFCTDVKYEDHGKGKKWYIYVDYQGAGKFD